MRKTIDSSGINALFLTQIQNVRNPTQHQQNEEGMILARVSLRTRAALALGKAFKQAKI